MLSRWLGSATRNTQQRLVHPLPHTSHTRDTRGGTLRRGPDEGSHRHEHTFFQIFKIRVFLCVYGEFAGGEQPPARIKHLAAIKDLYGA